MRARRFNWCVLATLTAALLCYHFLWSESAIRRRFQQNLAAVPTGWRDATLAEYHSGDHELHAQITLH